MEHTLGLRIMPAKLDALSFPALKDGACRAPAQLAHLTACAQDKGDPLSSHPQLALAPPIVR